MSPRAISHRDEIRIAVDPLEVWRLADDVTRYPEWVGVTIRMLAIPRVMEPGAVYTERTRIAGPVTTIGRWTVVTRDEGRLVQRHHCTDEPGPVKGMWLEMRVAPDGSGARFGLSIGCQVDAGPLTGPVAALMSRQLRTGNAANIRRFAKLLEGDGQHRAQLHAKR